MKKIIIAIILLFSILFVSGCSDKKEAYINANDPIVLGTMIDTEGGVIGNLILLSLEENNYLVEDKIQFGTPDVQRKALLEKVLDIGVDYTGNGQFYSEGYPAATWSDAEDAYKAINQADLNNGLVWLKPGPANNTESLAITKEFSKKNSIITMYDFAKYVNNGGKVKLITAQTFAENTVGLKGLEESYGFKLKPEQLILLPHGNTSEMIKALAEGTNDVNVSLVYATDGALNELNLVIIQDDKSIPPVYNPSAVVNKEVADKYPEIKMIIEEVFSGLDNTTLQEMNKKVVVDGLSPKEVAKEYLKTKGIIK